MLAGQTGPQECAGCGKKIHDKFILKVIIATLIVIVMQVVILFALVIIVMNMKRQRGEDACILGFI